VRGFIIRKRIQKSPEFHKTISLFSRDEYWETIRPDVRYRKRAKLEHKQYEYRCSGAVYIGEWKGGFREGKGLI